MKGALVTLGIVFATVVAWIFLKTEPGDRARAAGARPDSRGAREAHAPPAARAPPSPSGRSRTQPAAAARRPGSS